jgi:hypothetical protein
VGGPDNGETISFAEWQRHIRFDERGRKIVLEDPQESHRKFAEKMVQLRDRMKEHAARGGACPTCAQKLPPGWPRQSMAELLVAGAVTPDELFGE